MPLASFSGRPFARVARAQTSASRAASQRSFCAASSPQRVSRDERVRRAVEHTAEPCEDMGKGGAVLTVGRPLPWQEAKDKLTYVRQHGVDQFIQHYRRHATKQRDTLLYGDEIEYGLFKLSSSGASLSLRGDEVRSLLSNREAEERRAIPESGKVTWHPEYGADSASVSERF